MPTLGETVLNPQWEKRRVHSQNRRVRRKGRLGKLTTVEWMCRLVQTGFRCAYCGDGFEEMDHIVAVSQGGDTSYVNVLPSCRKCGRQKQTAIWLPARAGGASA